MPRRKPTTRAERDVAKYRAKNPGYQGNDKLLGEGLGRERILRDRKSQAARATGTKSKRAPKARMASGGTAKKAGGARKK